LTNLVPRPNVDRQRRDPTTLNKGPATGSPEINSMKDRARRFAFVQLDVFTSRPLEGNQLAVFTDARGLSDDEMQALAKEMNLSETTFILPGDAEAEQQHATRVRIFTVEEELDFAGHPTLGTAAVIREQMTSEGRDTTKVSVSLALRVGRISVAFNTDLHGCVFGEMRQRDPEFGPVCAPEEVAQAAGLTIADIDPRLPIQTVSTGIPFTVVPLRHAKTLHQLHRKFNFAAAQPYLTKAGGRNFYFVTRDTAALDGDARGARLEARSIFYNGEDPATGSAAGCCAAWMVRHGVAKSEEQLTIAQGLRIRRPSYLHVRAHRDHANVTDVRVGGNTVLVLRGEVTL
jgi:trans-2,3-dihydro-3-hydroxyanthranilate isomerase